MACSIFKEEEKNYSARAKYQLDQCNKPFHERTCAENQRVHVLQEHNKNTLKNAIYVKC